MNGCLLTLFILFIYNVYETPSAAPQPIFSFGILKKINGLKKRDAANETRHAKPYSGLRARNDSILMMYYHDQTIAIAEIGRDKLLLNCELIEVIEPKDANETLHTLSKTISRPLVITLEEMLELMQQCEMLDEPVNRYPETGTSTQPNSSESSRGFSFFSGSGNSLTSSNHASLSFLSGIAPGTKWCGTGDIAATYHDLGTDANVDKCCRTHDICPVKIAKYTNRYNVYNDSPFTRSLCACDDMLFNCLKASNSTSGNIFGNIFFNLVQTTCLDERDGKFMFRKNTNRF